MLSQNQYGGFLINSHRSVFHINSPELVWRVSSTTQSGAVRFITSLSTARSLCYFELVRTTSQECFLIGTLFSVKHST